MADTASVVPAADNAPISLHEAAGLMAPPEEPKDQGDAPAPEADAAPQDNSAEQADAGAEQPPSETDEPTDAAEELPPVEAPRSWSKADKDAFKALPPETQRSLLERERVRETEVNRRLSEAANANKAAEAQRQAAEQVRQQYEAALPNILGIIQQQLAGQYPDITTWDDVHRMRAQDPVRYLDWQASVQQAEQMGREVQVTQARQQQEHSARFDAFRTAETQKFLEAAPEFADPKTAPKMQAEVQSMFSDVGIGPDELKSLWNGQPISIHDHRVQLLIRDAALYRAAKKAVRTATPKPAAPVQKPGVATNRGEAKSAQIQQLDTELSRTGSRRAALALLNSASRN